MDFRFVYIIAALIGALLFYMATGYPRWVYGQNLLSSFSILFEGSNINNALFMTAAFLANIAAVLFTIYCAMGAKWAINVATVLIVLSAVLGLLGGFYYVDQLQSVLTTISAFLSTLAIPFTIAFALIFAISYTFSK